MRFTHPFITIILRSYGRPVRTKRMLDCIQAQTLNNFELIFMGDACPVVQDIIKSSWFEQWRAEFKRKGNHLFYMNNAIGGRDWGAKVTNQAIKIARGHYTCFADNDDIIKPEHLEFYYKGILHAKTDFVYCPVVINGPDGFWQRLLALRSGCVGHAEIVVKTEFLKQMPPHQPVYGQDWLLIEEMMKRGTYAEVDPAFPTYCVMSTDKYQEPGMEEDK
jgi:hypothetical protein